MSKCVVTHFAIISRWVLVVPVQPWEARQVAIGPMLDRVLGVGAWGWPTRARLSEAR